MQIIAVANILSKIKGQHVVIVGDMMIDRYLTGTVSRISPEAPVPVVLHESSEDRLGGAANVALNVQALGGVPLLCSVIGDDWDGRKLTEEILGANQIPNLGVCLSNNRKTTVKTRVLGNHQQMLRIDREDTHDLTPQEEEALLNSFQSLLSKFPVKAVILQDYNKGVMTETVIQKVISLAKKHGVFIAVDPKKANFFSYIGVDLFKPNLKEVRDSSPFAISATLESLEKSAQFIQKQLKNKFTMLTLSEKGLYLKGEKAGQIYPTIARNVADVSGAGDTVISIATMALAAGFELEEVAALSNLAGGQVCEFSGVVPVNLSLLEVEYDSLAER
jgi:rfaE bifunctional protein kinase chain/domain